MESSLSSLLWQLSKTAVEKVNELIKSEQLVEIEIPFIRSKIENFSYKEGAVSFITSFEEITRKEFHWHDLFLFQEEIIKLAPEFSTCVDLIAIQCEQSNEQAEHWLSVFFQRLIEKIVKEKTDDALIVDHITLFTKDLGNSPTEWRAEVWLQGIWLDDERYELEDGIVLRQPLSADFEKESRFDYLPTQNLLRGSSTPSAIIEFSLFSRDRKTIENKTKTIIEIFQLFRTGSIIKVREIISPISILGYSQESFPYVGFAQNHKYGFRDTDIKPLKDFLRKTAPLIPQEDEDSEEIIDPLRIAFQRYKDALLNPPPIESRITSAITCLEALFLQANERSELSHRLGQRVAALLRYVDFKPIEVYRNIKQAYDIRSTFIHGSQIESKKHSFAIKLCGKTLEYARLSLVLFFRLKTEIEKEELIKKLDNSLLDERSEERLKESWEKIACFNDRGLKDK